MRSCPIKALAASAAFLTVGACAPVQTTSASPWAMSNPNWVEPIEPFKVYDNIYFVGTRGLSSFLIATPDGHFLIDGGLPENAALIAANIAKLGYSMRDVRILLNSHAHFDHSGGLAALKEMSGAALVASDGDRSALEGGFYLGSQDDHDLDAPPIKVDRTIGDGEALSLGGVTLTAHLTPGHTRGCTSWTMNAANKETLFFCSATVAANRLVGSSSGPPQYDGIAEDYRATFAKTKGWRPDIFLANHPFFFNMEEKRARQLAGEDEAFVDREGFPMMMKRLESAFEKALAEQSAKAEKQ